MILADAKAGFVVHPFTPLCGEGLHALHVQRKDAGFMIVLSDKELLSLTHMLLRSHEYSQKVNGKAKSKKQRKS